MQTALVCICLLSMALSAPVPPPLPRRAAGNCVGQHRILLKGCNAKHGFYVFKYVYSFSTRRNQTQIKKEEADSQSTIPSHRLGEGNARRGPTEDNAAPEQEDNGSTDAMENGTHLKPENNSAPGVGRDTHSPLPGTSTQLHGGVGITGPSPASSEGSGDLDLVVEVNGDVSILPQGGHPSEAVAGNRSSVRSEDRDDGASVRIPVERAKGVPVEGRERTRATGEAENEGSGEATVPGQGQEGIMQGRGMGGANLASVTEKMEDIQVDAKGVDEYAYIPDSGSITVTSGKMGSTSFTQISPDKDDEVNIFIGRANIHTGVQETTQASATVDSEDDSTPTAATSSPPPRLRITVAHDDDDNDGVPAHRQPEEPATTVTMSHGDRVTSSPGNGHLIGENEDGATTVGDREGTVAPSPWRVAGGDITVSAGIDNHENGDDEVRGEGQRLEEQPDHLAVTISRQGSDKEATATVPAQRASIRLGTTVISPGVSEGDCTTALGMASVRKAGESTVAGTGASGEVGTVTPQPHREGQPRVGVRVWPGGAGLDKTPRVDKMPSPPGKAGGWAVSGAQTRAGGHGGNAGGRLRAPEAGGSPPAQAGQAGGSVAAGEGQKQGQGGKARVVVAGSGRLPGRHGRRPGAGVPGMFAALGHSRQVDQVKRADELHVRERAFYTLGGAGGGPRRPYPGLGSADSSQSSEGDRGSRSDSQQTGLRPSGWGAPGHPYGHWSQGAL